MGCCLQTLLKFGETTISDIIRFVANTNQNFGMPILIFLVISGLVGGGVSAAANGSLPGDALYGVKVGVNEPVKEFFAFSRQAKASAEADIAIARAQEIEKLAVKGKVDARTAASLETSFENHAGEAAKLIAALSSAAAIEANSNFQSSLGAHGNIIAKLAKNQPDDQEALLSFSAKISKADGETEDAQIAAEAKFKSGDQTGFEASAQEKLSEALNKIDEVNAYIKAKGPLSADVQTEVDARMQAANQDIADGKTKIDAKAYAEAFIDFQKAAHEAEQAKEFVSSDAEIDLEVKSEGKSGETENRAENNTEVKSGANENVETNQTGDEGVNANVNVNVKTDKEGSKTDKDTKPEGSSGENGGAEGGANIKVGL